MKKIFEIKDKHEFQPLIIEIEDKPTSPLARWLLYIVTAFIIITCIWLYIGKVDIVVSSKGKIMPNGEIKIVQAMESGVLQTILVKEGEFVKKGQILILLNKSINSTNLNQKQQEKETLSKNIKRLNALLKNKLFISNDKVQNNLYKIQKDNLNNIRRIYYNAKKQEKNLKKVKDIISKSEYENARSRMLESKQQLIGTKNSFLEELNKNKQELIQTNSTIDNIIFSKQKQSILSPVDGYVGKLLVHTKDAIVTPAQKLISIIPKDAPLILKVNVLNQDIGFIKEDMNVSIKVDTYNFQKYGLINGVISHISNDAIEDEKLGLVYEVYIVPSQNYLTYANKKHNLSSGMSITAEVKIGKRRVINFFIYPLIRYLDESVSVR